LLAAGERALEQLFPGLADRLLADGAVRIDAAADALWFQAGAFRPQYTSGIQGAFFSRPLLEMHVRRRVSAQPNVEICQGVQVDRLVTDDRGAVTGVVVRGGPAAGIPADLVVDASGRGGQSGRWLEECGYEAPQVSKINIGVGYATVMLRRRPGDLEGGLFTVVAPTGADGKRLGVAFPVEGDRWIVTLGGWHNDHPPTDLDGFRAFAATLPAPVIADLLAKAEVLTPILTHKFPFNQRRHFEKLRRVPAGYVAMGDTVCSFNPIYGQGMTSAALQALALGRCIDRYGTGSDRFPKAFYRQVGKVVSNPWQIAAGADFIYPETTGPKPPGTDFINRYVGRVMLAGHTSERACTAMISVQNLLSPPPSLMKPGLLVHVLRAAKRSPALVQPARESVVGPVPVVAAHTGPGTAP
jgi:2-polyprenyl-6-methoxyphenol hydroxylase-like FAD-dependent oxidoreductase